MSDLHYYPKLPPIKSGNTGDDSSEEAAERPSSVLDLGDIDVSCLTKAQPEDVANCCQSENETDENARRDTNNLPTSKNRSERIPETGRQDITTERNLQSSIRPTPTNTPNGLPVNGRQVMEIDKILRIKSKGIHEADGTFSYNGHVQNTITTTNKSADVRHTANTSSCSEHILSSSTTPTNMANYEKDEIRTEKSPPSTDSVESIKSESQCSVQVESVNSNASCVAHFVEDAEPGQYKAEHNLAFPSPEMNIHVVTKDDNVSESRLAIEDAISGNEILPSLKGSEPNDVISGAANLTDVECDSRSNPNMKELFELRELLHPKPDVDLSSDVDDAHQVISINEPKSDLNFSPIPEEKLPEVDQVDRSQHILPSIEEDISDDADVDQSRRQTTPASDDIISNDDTDSSDVDFDYRMNLDDLDYVLDDNLLTPEQQEEQRLWDLEFEKRRRDLEITKKNAAIRREDYRNRLENLTVRWNGIEKRLENRQVEKRQQLYQNLQQLLTDNKRS